MTRMMDDKMNALQRQGRMGTYVSCAGQEATQVGAVFGLSKKDWIFPMYRDLGMMIQAGVPIDSIMNRLFSNAQDATLGRDLPNAYAWRDYKSIQPRCADRVSSLSCGWICHGCKDEKG